jgi:endoglucanase
MQAIANPDKYGENGSDPKHITEKGKTYGDVDKGTIGLTGNDALFIQMYLLHMRSTLTPII